MKKQGFLKRDSLNLSVDKNKLVASLRTSVLVSESSEVQPFNHWRHSGVFIVNFEHIVNYITYTLSYC